MASAHRAANANPPYISSRRSSGVSTNISALKPAVPISPWNFSLQLRFVLKPFGNHLSQCLSLAFHFQRHFKHVPIGSLSSLDLTRHDDIDCAATAFATNPLGIICAPEHPLSRRRNAPPAILNDQEFVVRENGSGTRQAMERLFAEHAINPQIVMEMPSNETIKQAVMAGMGLSFLSLRTIRHELASGHLVLLDIEGLPIMLHWYVTHLSSKRLSPAANALKSFLIDEAGPLVNLWA